jgi:copper transport protein
MVQTKKLPNKIWLKIILSITAAAFVLGLFPNLASAHAQFVRSNPSANSSLPAGKPPVQVQIWFSEQIEPNFSKIEVFDKDGKKVDKNDSQVPPGDSYSVAVTLPLTLPDGAYTVSYRNVSKEDGHSVKGNFSFLVGAGALPSTAVSLLDGATAPDESNFTIWSVVMRWVNYLGMAGLVGGLVFLLLVWRPSAKRAEKRVGAELGEATQKVELRTYTLIGYSLGILGLGWFGFVIYQATVAGNCYPWEIFNNSVITNLLINSRLGNIWLVRLDIILVGVLVWAFGRGGNAKTPPEIELVDNTVLRSWALWGLLGLGVAVMGTTALTSHAAASTTSWLLVPTDVLHLISTGFWVGGLFYLVLALPIALKTLVPGTGDRTRLLAVLIPNFSFIAILSVGLLLTTGTLQAAFHLGSLDAFFSSGYGLALFIKLCLLVPLLLLGAFNLLRISPRLLKASRSTNENTGAGSLVAGKLQQIFRRSVRVEMVVMVALLLAVGALTSFGPPQQDNTRTGTLFTVTGQMGDLKYTLAISPMIVGENIFELEVKDAAGKPVENASNVYMRFTHTVMDMGLQELELKALSGRPGRYSGVGTYFSMTGDWEIQLLIRRAGADDVTTLLKLPVK